MIYKISPVFKDYIWGGTRLRDEFGKKADCTPVAESWELSCHPDGLSLLAESGEALAEHISKCPAVLGENVRSGELPILIKLIDAADNLSVQVHPNDEFAKKYENQNGKTEMWYVVDALPGAKITYGLKKASSKEELAAAIAEGRAEELLNSVPAKKGDVFFVAAGTIHAIGGGCLIAEIQQNSNVTYRLYDYKRIGKDGKPRELHIEKGVACANTQPVERPEPRTLPDGSRVLGECPFFRVTEHIITGENTFNADSRSYNAVLITDGECEIQCGGGGVRMSRGDCAFIDAGTGEYTVKGNCTLLLTVQP